MNPLNRKMAFLTLAAGALWIGCGGSDSTGPAEPQPEPGELQVTVYGSVALGGLVLTVTGPGISAPAAPSGATLYYDLSGDTLRAVVVASSLSGQALRFSVPDVRDASQYQASLEQVAGTGNQTLEAGGYSATVSLAP